MLFSISCGDSTTQVTPTVHEFDITKKYPSKTLDINDLAKIEYLILESCDSFLYTHFSYLSDNYILTFNTYDGSYVFFDRKGKKAFKYCFKNGSRS